MIRKALAYVGLSRSTGPDEKMVDLRGLNKPAASGASVADSASPLIQAFRKRLQLQASPGPSADANGLRGETLRPPVFRSAGQWTTLVGLLLCASVVVWIMFSAWALVSVAHASAEVRLRPPVLKAYPPLAQTRLFSPPVLDQDIQRLLSPEQDSLVRVFQNIAAFENARAEELLRSSPTTVQSVLAGSPAAAAGLQVGDRITRINEAPADFVWDLYKALTQTPQQSIAIAFQRGETPLNAVADLEEGAAFDMTNHGLLFDVPAHIRYLGPTDVSRLAKQLRTDYVNAAPSEWRRAYVDGLLTMTQEIVANLSALAAAPPDGKNYIRSEELLSWYHGKFLEAADGQRTTLMRLQALQTQALYELGLGLLAAGLACLVGLGVAMRSQWEVS